MTVLVKHEPNVPHLTARETSQKRTGKVDFQACVSNSPQRFKHVCRAPYSFLVMFDEDCHTVVNPSCVHTLFSATGLTMVSPSIGFIRPSTRSRARTPARSWSDPSAPS